MLAKTLSVALMGADAHLVEVEVHATQGVPNFTVVGLPAKSVREAEQRTRSALLSSDQRWPPCRTVANLAPASLRKEGTHFDLAIAAGILAADKRLTQEQLEGWVFVGELSLDGSIRPVRGVLPCAIAARASGCSGIVCPAPNGGEAALVDDLEVVPVASLGECIRFLRNQWRPGPVERVAPPHAPPKPDMADVRGQPMARRAIEAAAAGGHNLMLRGAPGTGKTMLARRLPSILPEMSRDEALDVTRLYSVAGLLGERPALLSERPFRMPHHDVSTAGLIGGGPSLARPGEIALANHGVLFMDELPLFRRDVLESLRGPLEDGVVHVTRSAGTVSFPCRFSLVAAMNPCPCGYLEDVTRSCACTPARLRRHRARLSGPLLDRFDLQVSTAKVTGDDLLRAPAGEPSVRIRERVETARAVQRERYAAPGVTNASAAKGDLLRTGAFTAGSFTSLRHHVDTGSLTGRGCERVLRVARTLADLDGARDVTETQIAEALAFRLLLVPEEVAA